MAKKGPRHGRTLIAFVIAVLAIYGGLALNGNWTPKLGLDLQGGTRITLQASTATGEAITPEKLREAADIIDSRVNAYGVAESEVSTQGDNNIVVEIPGQEVKEIVDTVQQTAQLRFRLVAASGLDPSAQPTPTDSPSADATTDPDADPSADPSASPSADPSPAATDQPEESGSQAPADGAESSAPATGRAMSEGLRRADAEPTAEASPTEAGPTAEATPAEGEAPAQPGAVPTNEASVDELLAWSRNPDPTSLQRFEEFTCAEADEQTDNPAQPLLACDDNGVKFLLSPAVVEGTQLNDASFGIPQNQVQYVVTLDFNGEATATFADLTRAISGTQEQFAIVLDREVLTAPVVTTPIADGNAQISGDFTAASSESLANSLKYGALPLTFEAPVVTEEGPTLAAGQLEAGLIAGSIGLVLVLIYSMAYYRGLGVVVVASLVSAAALIYAAILFLSENAGFTLTLPGIAGLIVGVGITADSFIVLFERIRDEMRDGRSVRVAVEEGWDRAKWTCVIADGVGLLAAVVLYIFSIGVVKGFAFMLGVTTVIDLLVFFVLTKPMVSWLVRFSFFAKGHRLSGLSAEQAGIDRIGVPRAAGEGAR